MDFSAGWRLTKNNCNRHLSIDNQIDHRSYERQGKLKVPTIHEGADARKIEEKYLTGQIRKGSWKVEKNQMIRSKIFISDCVVFFDTIATFIQTIAGWVVLTGKNMAQISDGISNPVIAGIIYWLIKILVC